MKLCGTIIKSWILIFINFKNQFANKAKWSGVVPSLFPDFLFSTFPIMNLHTAKWSGVVASSLFHGFLFSSISNINLQTKANEVVWYYHYFLDSYFQQFQKSICKQSQMKWCDTITISWIRIFNNFQKSICKQSQIKWCGTIIIS